MEGERACWQVWNTVDVEQHRYYYGWKGKGPVGRFGTLGWLAEELGPILGWKGKGPVGRFGTLKTTSASRPAIVVGRGKGLLAGLEHIDYALEVGYYIVGRGKGLLAGLELLPSHVDGPRFRWVGRGKGLLAGLEPEKVK